MNLAGNPLDFLLAFFGGILLSFTPCVYPLIPISLGYMGVRAEGSKIKGLTLSLVYVTGIAVTYSILGLVASLGGSFFGEFSVNPKTRILVGLVIVGFGLSMLDFFHLWMPNLIKLPAAKKQGYFSALVLGLCSGLIVSPCVSPVLGSILVYIAAKKNIFYGSVLLFSFAYGMGFLLILVGTFSSVLLNLPRSGRWMLYIKKVLAFILIGAGFYFIFVALKRLCH